MVVTTKILSTNGSLSALPLSVRSALSIYLGTEVSLRHED